MYRIAFNVANMSRGVLYIASGEPYVSWAVESAKSVKERMPDIGTTLVTDEKDIDTAVFDTIKSSNEENPGLSPIKPGQSPYDRTLFLDADTYVARPVYELFDILDDHHMAFTQSPGRLKVPGLPDPWIEFNNGVIAYKDCEATNNFLQQWEQVYEQMRRRGETTRQQPTFARTVYESDIDYFVLPREYNVRVPRYGYLVNEAKIIHGGHFSVPLEEIAKTLNAKSGQRIHWPVIYWNLTRDVKVESRAENRHTLKNIVFLFYKSVKKHGWKHALKHAGIEIKEILRRQR